MYVCQSVHCDTSLLKLCYPVLDELSFSNFLQKFLGFLYTSSNNCRFFVCLSVCSLPNFFIEIMLSSSRWAIFFQIFRRHSRDVSAIFKIIYDFLYVGQSVHCLTSLLKLCEQWISPVLDELAFSNVLETLLGYLYTCSE